MNSSKESPHSTPAQPKGTPPRKSPIGLSISVSLMIGWLVFLIYLAWVVTPESTETYMTEPELVAPDSE